MGTEKTNCVKYEKFIVKGIEIVEMITENANSAKYEKFVKKKPCPLHLHIFNQVDDLNGEYGVPGTRGCRGRPESD